MLEVEMKFRVPDWDDLLNRMTMLQATPRAPRKDADHYFNAPHRDFAETDEAVRLRRIGSTNFLTYKGPKFDSATKSRLEVELELAEGPDAATKAVRFLSCLGFRPVAVVSKSRQVFALHRDTFEVEVCLDDVGAVGKFVEIEIQCEKEQFEQAKLAVQTLAADLGLQDYERRSYLQLLLDQNLVRTPIPPTRKG